MIAWTDLGLSPVLFDFGFFQLHWYAIAYVAGFIVGFWYLKRIARTAGSPLAERHVEDLAVCTILGVMIGGRLLYVFVYAPTHFASEPLSILNLQRGGMSFHGGVLGVAAGLLYVSWRQGLNWLRVHDYVACCVPFGLFFGRVGNFVNAELWGAPTALPWAIRFPEATPFGTILGPPRHPTQLYEALLEGVVLFAILWWMFWKTDARYYPGRLVGAFLFFYGLFRFAVELVREPDAQLVEFAATSGLNMGQWLSLPMIAGGMYLMATAKRGATEAPAAA